jgi:hypothetical protein
VPLVQHDPLAGDGQEVWHRFGGGGGEQMPPPLYFYCISFSIVKGLQTRSNRAIYLNISRTNKHTDNEALIQFHSEVLGNGKIKNFEYLSTLARCSTSISNISMHSKVCYVIFHDI